MSTSLVTITAPNQDPLGSLAEMEAAAVREAEAVAKKEAEIAAKKEAERQNILGQLKGIKILNLTTLCKFKTVLGPRDVVPAVSVYLIRPLAMTVAAYVGPEADWDWSYCPNLQKFSCPFQNAKTTKELVAGLPSSLRVLEMNTQVLTNEELRKLLQTCPLVVPPDLSGCGWWVNDETLNILAEHRVLNRLVLDASKNLSNAALKNLLEKHPKLPTISLRGCAWVTSETVDILANHPGLKNLDLRGCENIKAAVEALEAARPEVTVKYGPVWDDPWNFSS